MTLGLSLGGLMNMLATALRITESLNLLWELFSQHGSSLRVIATSAELVGFWPPTLSTVAPSALEGTDRQELAKLLHEWQLA
ncbi:hypothetical protein [Halomonas sp. KRD171]|uniref:hypothetical protein n=1 Tax=Halomonas sp. KRD171 TaxID=2729726 RepID=UPI0006B3CB00|nr:hypothetical protein [Halomonas sp. KRD171]